MILKISLLKKKVGYIRRGFFGFFINKIEKSPKINKSIKNNILEGIEYFEIGNGQQKIIFISAIHGNEIGTVKLAYNLINWLDKENEFKKLFTFYVIPCLNKDGYNQAIKNPDYFNGGKIGRFNINNVDLNRNFSTPSFKKESIYSFGKNYKEKEKVYCGEYGGSEIEINALTNLIKNKNVKVAYFFHNAGKDVMGNKNNLSQKLVKLYSEKTGFKFVLEEEWQKMEQTGTAKEWCEINNIAYIEVEGSNRWGSDWKIQRSAIEATLKEIELTKELKML